MKRLLSAALILSLLGGTAAVAAPAGRMDYGHSHANNNGAVIAGVGLLALAAIVASQSHSDYGYHEAYGPPPPPAPEWRADWHRDWHPDWHRDYHDYRGYGR